MDKSDRERIIGEAKKNIADKDKFNYVPSSDPLTRWREQAAQFEAEVRQGQQELRDEERRRAETPEAWDRWLYAQLSRHLANHPVLGARFEGVGQAIGEMIAELRGRIDANNIIQNQQRDEIRKLQIELAELRIKVAELRTDQVLASMPLSTSRSSVN
jgi:hypothetical protein